MQPGDMRTSLVLYHGQVPHACLLSDTIPSLWLTLILIASFGVQGQGSSKGMRAGLTPPFHGPLRGQPATQSHRSSPSSAPLHCCHSCIQPWHQLQPLGQLPIRKAYTVNCLQAFTKPHLFVWSLSVPVAVGMGIRKHQKQGQFIIQKELMRKTTISEADNLCEVQCKLWSPAAK